MPRLVACVFGMKILAVDINNQPVWIGQQKGVVVGEIVYLENDPGAAGLKLRYPNLLQKPVIHIEALAHQRRCQLSVAQIEENAVRVRDALGSELDLTLQINGDSRVIRRRPVPDSCNPRHATGTRVGCFLTRAGLTVGRDVGLGLDFGIGFLARRIVLRPALISICGLFPQLFPPLGLFRECGLAVHFRHGLLCVFRQAIMGIAA